jgi:hypothetical protein
MSPRAEAGAMAYRVARAWRGDEHDVVIATFDLAQDVIAESVGEHVVCGSTDLGVDGSDVDPSLAKMGCDVTLVPSAGEDDEGCGPGCGSLRRADASRCGYANADVSEGETMWIGSLSCLVESFNFTLDKALRVQSRPSRLLMMRMMGLASGRSLDLLGDVGGG